MADKDKITGKALYMEFRNGGATYQMIITPDGVSSNGRAVPATMYRRQISKLKPRKAWKTYSLPAVPLNAFGAYDALQEADAMEKSSARLEYVASSFTQLVSYKYELYKQPIFVEVSQEDIEQVRIAKTPYKILGRITRVRRSLGFGEALFTD